MPHIEDQRRIIDLELMVQRLQHRLRIYEMAKAIVDDEKIMDENDLEKSDDSSTNNKSYLRREHHKYHPREHVRCDDHRYRPMEHARGDDREYGRGDWYERHDRYDEGRDRRDDRDYHDRRGYYGN